MTGQGKLALTDQLISRVVEVGGAAVVEGGDVDGVGPGRGVGRRGRLPRTGAAEAAIEGTAGSCKAGKLLTIAMLCLLQPVSL